MLKSITIILCALALASCGGNWDNDTKNWSRAFNGQTPPDDVKVAHSRYFRSAHFTYEAYYYFELTATQEFLDAWLKGLVKAPPSQDNLGALPNKPDWFIPEPLENYDMWVIENNSDSNFRLFRHKSSGTIFATDCEL